MGTAGAGHSESVEAVQFCHQLPVLATGGVEGTLGLWDAATMAPRNTCSHPEVRSQLVCESQILKHGVQRFQVLCRASLG